MKFQELRQYNSLPVAAPAKLLTGLRIYFKGCFPFQLLIFALMYLQVSVWEIASIVLLLVQFVLTTWMAMEEGKTRFDLKVEHSFWWSFNWRLVYLLGPVFFLGLVMLIVTALSQGVRIGDEYFRQPHVAISAILFLTVIFSFLIAHVAGQAWLVSALLQGEGKGTSSEEE